MSFLKRRWRGFIFSLVNHFFCGTHSYALKRKLLNSCFGIHIGKGTKIVCPFTAGNCSSITVGVNCWVGAGCRVYGDGRVTVGDNCDLAPDVAFITGSHEIGSADRRAGKGVLFDITVEDGCWLGARCSVIGNTIVHYASVVGASALVNKSVEANGIVAGVPAKSIGVIGS